MPSLFKFIDSHAHLSSPELFPQAEDILKRAKDAGVEAVVNICTDPETLKLGFQLSSRHPWIYNSAATTPHDVEAEGEEAFPILAEAARSGRLAAVGETGLDYHYTHSDPALQRDFLRRYLRLALECNLPVIIHCREAFRDFFKILDEEYAVGGKHGPGVLHCFTGTAAEAQEVLSRGFYLSLSGIVTFKKSDALREVAKLTPLDKLLIETDSPYLAPQSKRGKTNEPAYLPETAAAIAAAKDLPLEKLAAASVDNARRLFKFIPKPK